MLTEKLIENIKKQFEFHEDAITRANITIRQLSKQYNTLVFSAFEVLKPDSATELIKLTLNMQKAERQNTLESLGALKIIVTEVQALIKDKQENLCLH